MSKLALAVLIAASFAGAAAAQTTAGRGAAPARPGGAERPVDRGPYTPEANRAYQGGGVVLQGAPGAPAPAPQPTPPGQPPANMVPSR